MIQSKEKQKLQKVIQKNVEFKKKLGLDPNVVTCDERGIISALQVPYEGEIILTQHCIKKKRLDAYFPKYKLRQKLINIIMKVEILDTNKADN